MADQKRLAALKALELLQNIQEDDSDAESDIKSDIDVYDLHEDNCNNSESESSSDNQLLVSESNSEISSFVDMETNFEMDEGLVHQDNSTSARITWDISDPDQNNSGRQSCHNVITEAPGPSAQTHRSLSKNWFAVHWIYLLMKVCSIKNIDVPKKKLEEFYKQTMDAGRYTN